MQQFLFRDIKKVRRLKQNFPADTFVTQHTGYLFSDFRAMTAAFASNSDNSHGNGLLDQSVYSSIENRILGARFLYWIP
jgi:predicted oxidoreductase (fatty acid repression mutant protein)